MASERALRFGAVDVQVVLEEMVLSGNRINLVILDACRNNPFERRFRGRSRGLAAIPAYFGIIDICAERGCRRIDPRESE